MTLHYFHIVQACLKLIINNDLFDARSVSISDYISSICVQKVLLLKKLKSLLSKKMHVAISFRERLGFSHFFLLEVPEKDLYTVFRKHTNLKLF